ncbi:MAG: hydantoinase B/oxoprolinase family protein [Myxococcota bacterium]|nr:hydantoinase B/oxoprolinase family protein [Myxococcota bacterium]
MLRHHHKLDPNAPQLKIAVDTGGTFTDVVVSHLGQDRHHHFKIPSTPEAPERAVVAAVQEGMNYFSENLLELRHGTTVATNTLLENTGAPTVLVTTEGFEDLLLLARQNRPELYELMPVAPLPIIERPFTLGFPERLDAQGHSLHELPDIPGWVHQHEEIFKSAKAVAICFLHSYRNPQNENALAEVVSAMHPELFVVTSSSLIPLAKEYERTLTTAANARLAPVMTRYLGRLRSALGTTAARIQISDSTGGLIPLERAAKEPIRTALSGPSGGVVGAWFAAQRFGFNKVLTLDMGGTSTDISLSDGLPEPSPTGKVGDIGLNLPMLEITTIGAGGGSLAFADETKLLQVGPKSAGAKPGPACYGLDGFIDRPTITDANIVLGRLDTLLSGAFEISHAHSHAAINKLAKKLNKSPIETAQGIIRLAEAQMLKACKNASAAKGVDPRELTMVAFGGAGGLHACAIAEELGIKKVLIPNHSGVLSAAGIQRTRHHVSAVRSIHQNIEKIKRLNLAEYIREVWVKYIDELYDQNTTTHFTLLFDCSYKGQSSTIPIVLIRSEFPSDKITASNGITILTDAANASLTEEKLSDKFTKAYHKNFGHVLQGYTIEAADIRINLYCQAQGSISSPEEPEPTEQATGPATIPNYDSTLWIPDNWIAQKFSTGDWICSFVPPDKSLNALFSSTLDLEIHKLKLQSIAEDMGAVLQRTSFSANIRERRDYSCAIFDSDGQLLAQAAHIPVHLGSQATCVQQALKTIRFTPNESVIVNDPYSGGTHLPDVTIITPVFIQDKAAPQFYVASRAHHADIGGRVPGSMPAPFDEQGNPIELTIHDEGIRLPPCCLTAATRERFATASRTPSDRYADLRAQEAANETGKDELTQYLLKLNPDKIRERNEFLLCDSKHKTEKLIETMPDGQYIFTDHLDDDGVSQEPIPISVRLTVGGSELEFDFSQSGNQVSSGLNAVRSVTTAAVFYVLGCLSVKDIAINQGIIDAVKIVTRPGSICDAEYPAAVSAGNVETSQRLVDTILGAFAQIFPNKIPAASCGSMNNILFGGQTAGPQKQNFVHYETIGGGHGASASQHGASAMHAHMTNTLNTPIEDLERLFPVRIMRYSLAPFTQPDVLENCGGAGVIRHYKFLTEAKVTILGDRQKIPPYGLNGATPGQFRTTRLIRESGKPQPIQSKAYLQLNPGDELEITTAGGGNHSSG